MEGVHPKSGEGDIPANVMPAKSCLFFSEDSHAMNKGPDAPSSCLICTSAMNWGQEVPSRSPSWMFQSASSFILHTAVFLQRYVRVFLVCSKQNFIPINLELSLSLEDPADNS